MDDVWIMYVWMMCGWIMYWLCMDNVKNMYGLCMD